jgi:uncharacterized protein
VSLPIFLAAILISMIGSMAGLGGGIFMIPFLNLCLGVPLTEAIATVACALGPSALVSSLFNYRQKLIRFKVAFILEPATLLGVPLGIYLSTIIPVRLLSFALILFLFFMSYKLWKKGQKEKALLQSKELPLQKAPPLFLASLSGLSAGVLSGLLGVGGGVIKTPLMIGLFRLQPREAVATSLFMMVFTGFSSGIGHYLSKEIPLTLIVPVLLGFIIGPILSRPLQNRLPQKNFLTFIALVNIFVALLLLFKQVKGL